MADKPGRVFFQLIPEPYALGAGRVITVWAWVEALIDQFIWRLLGVRSLRGRIVTANLSARAKIELLATLMRKSRMNEPFIKKIEKRGNALADSRNLVAHGYIAVLPDKPYGTAISFLARGRLTNRTRLVTPDLLNDVAAEIGNFALFLIDEQGRFPKQRGTRQRPAAPSPTSPRRRLETMLKQLPPPLVVASGSTEEKEKQDLRRLEKRARREADRQRDLAKRQGNGL